MNAFDKYVDGLNIRKCESLTNVDEVFIYFCANQNPSIKGVNFNNKLEAKYVGKHTYEIEIPNYDAIESFYIPYNITSAKFICLIEKNSYECGRYYIEDQYKSIKDKQKILTKDTDISAVEIMNGNEPEFIKISPYFKWFPITLAPFMKYKIVFTVGVNIISDLETIPVIISTLIIDNRLRTEMFKNFRDLKTIYHFERNETFYIMKECTFFPFEKTVENTVKIVFEKTMDFKEINVDVLRN